jgi:hypothetical protein
MVGQTDGKKELKKNYHCCAWFAEYLFQTGQPLQIHPVPLFLAASTPCRYEKDRTHKKNEAAQAFRSF